MTTTKSPTSPASRLVVAPARDPFPLVQTPPTRQTKAHGYGFERNRTSGMWRARCPDCSWSAAGERDDVIAAAAKHDIEWMIP